jgi:SAM-dependent methyltransferase
MVDVICPACRHSVLEIGEDGTLCRGCGRKYPIKSGILVLTGSDEFYEGKFDGTCLLPERDRPDSRPSLKQRLNRKFSLVQRRDKFFSKYIPNEAGRILDLACGGGNELFSRRGSVTGVDLSFNSLTNARNLYEQVIQVSVDKLPFPDKSFDWIVSSDFLGHIYPDEKQDSYNEMDRVLKPGGGMIHLLETRGEGLMAWARRYPELYERNFIDEDGHFGLEHDCRAIDRFRKLGLTPVCEKKAFDVIWPIGQYKKRFQNGYIDKSKLIKLVAGIDGRIFRSERLTKYFNFILGGVDIVTASVLPFDWAVGLLVFYRKP